MRRIEEMHKDQIDEHILEFLRNDSRESFVEIGKDLPKHKNKYYSPKKII